MKQTKNNQKIGTLVFLDKTVKIALEIVTLICAGIIVFITIFILIKGLMPFIKKYEINGGTYTVNFFKFIVGLKWKTGVSEYGIGYIILNTFFVTILALIIATPISIFSSLFIAKIAPHWLASILNRTIELLSSIPSVIYGLFGVGVITSFVNNLGNLFGYQSAGGMSLLSSAIVLAMMIMPTITMISITSISAIDEKLINGSLALGASKTQTNFKVVLASAKSGIFSGIILGVGRALGEATAVSLVCGNAGSGPTFNPFDITKTLTSAMLQGINETIGLDYDIRFSVGIILIIIILLTNLLLNFIKNKIGKSYDRQYKKNKTA